MFDDLKGYIFSGFTEKEKYLEKQSGYWTGFYESGVIKEEILVWGDGGEIRKKITYDTDGDITRIEEHEGDDWGRHISVTFHGNIKYLKESESGGAIFIKFD
tara:strand:- start:89 stop:394 length:306 start_codon:yes stop_codon:yes gene_type:complete